MRLDIDRVLISHDRIAARIAELAARITDDHNGASADGEIAIVPIMTGAMIFCGDLIRQIPLPMKIGLVAVTSYPGSAVRAQEPKVLGQQLNRLAGRHVLVLDDILDSGGTLRTVIPMIEALGPASVKSCVLLRKDRPEARKTHVDYVGFDIPDEFVVGYGLDYNDYYRNLPDIVTLTPEAMRRHA
jgi:hypoxanthine phosphoribosyltransferase